MYVYGSINQFLDRIHKPDALDFLPVFGQLNWNDLLDFRTTGYNPGTIYHPRSKTNYFYPHYTYGGASVFMRHDLIHQKLLKALIDIQTVELYSTQTP